jgi:plastocyanin
MLRRLPSCVVAVLAFTAIATAAAPTRAAQLPGASVSAARLVRGPSYPGMQHLHYEYGPIAISPGQNTIEFRPNELKPSAPGYIVRFRPNLVCARTDSTCGKDHSVPRVDVIHLHHGVWAINYYPTFAAGEEKTVFNFPEGFGLHSDPGDSWIMNYMIHNLTPNPTAVFVTYDIDFVPDNEPAAAGITPVHPLWMDVSGPNVYPVFDAHRRDGRHGLFVFPDEARGAQRKAIGPWHDWAAPKDVTLVTGIGHLHPGGLYDDLTVTRAGVTKRVFRSQAKYFEPAGAVSWDVATTEPKPDWRVALKAGDHVGVHAGYDTRAASWYEAMGIMIMFYADGVTAAAKDPFAESVDWHGWLTHGHLPENDQHGGRVDIGLPDARTLLAGPPVGNVSIKDFVFGNGDLSGSGLRGRPPVVRAGKALRFTNLDALRTMAPEASAYHTITACRTPCTKDTGIAYPLADGPVPFDSGELGYGPAGATPAANRNTWTTPRSLAPGTYTYFCRIHPFMRGAFRVVRASRSRR